MNRSSLAAAIAVGISLSTYASVAQTNSHPISDYLPFSERALFDGTTIDEGTCRSLTLSVWVQVDGIGDCVRYYASRIQPGPHSRAMVFLHGDRVAGTRVGNNLQSLSNYARTTPADIQRQVDAWAQSVGMPYIFLARPGTYGSSGDHTHRRRPREVAVVAAAFDAIATKHGIARFGFAGQSGGGLLVAALLASRRDIECAALSSAPSSLQARIRALNRRVDTTGYHDSVDPSEMVSKIRKDPSPRIFVIGDPRDKTVPYTSQLDYVTKLQSAGLSPVQIDGKARDPNFHSLDEHGRMASIMCMNGQTDEQIRTRLSQLDQ
jgi:pimeloyl-ACP methyl ester carboxylesterase